MDFTITKNSATDLNLFFYKKGMTNIHRPFLSLLKIDSSKQADAFFHIGFKQNMGFSSTNPIISGVMIFEVLEGYPMQSIMFINNEEVSKPFKQSLEDLEPMDLYCIQKRNEDPWGDFVLKNVKFIDTKYNQSVDDFSRRLIATFVAESRESFRVPFFYNFFKSDTYENHIIRSSSEVEDIKKDIDCTWSLIPVYKKLEIAKALRIPIEEFKRNSKILLEQVELKKTIDHLWKLAVLDTLKGTKKTIHSPIFILRDFITVYYKYTNELNYKRSLARGDLDFLQFINIDLKDINSETVGEIESNKLIQNVTPASNKKELSANTDSSRDSDFIETPTEETQQKAPAYIPEYRRENVREFQVNKNEIKTNKKNNTIITGLTKKEVPNGI